MMNRFKSRQTSTLLQRVSDDVGNLRQDLMSLLGHTTKRVLPDSARDVSEKAKQQLSAGREFVRNRIPSCCSSDDRRAQVTLGVAVVVGSLALAAYLNRHRISNLLNSDIDDVDHSI